MNPAATPVRLGVILLCHGTLERAAQAARLWAEGGAALAIHVDARAPEPAFKVLRAALADHPQIVFVDRRPCRWGDFSLVAATQDAATRLLQDHPDLTHVALVSGACLPLRPVAEFCAWLARDPTCDHIESFTAEDVGWTVDGLQSERFTLFFPFDWRRRRAWFDRAVRWQRRLGVRRPLPDGIVPHLGSQWWCLTGATLRAILADPRRAALDHWFATTWIPDESYFQTLARRHGARLRCQSPTLAQFDAHGRPFVLHDDHRDLLIRSRAFIARKVWPGAEGLYRAFPRPADDPAAEPDMTEVRALAEAARRRRWSGRPGLIMQSRWLRSDAPQGRTAGPYAVLHGLGDLFDDLPGWLAPRLPAAQVHGALFAPKGAQFAGGAALGPGGLSPVAALRDHDLRGWLTGLIRHAPRMPVWLASPRDEAARGHVDLDWFMAGDPQARILMVTGAWVVDLLQTGLPLDEMRRRALHLHRVETWQIAALDSPWTRARVVRLTLAQALADPGAALGQALDLIAPGTALSGPLPPLRDTQGLHTLLAALRDAGAPLSLTGPLTERTPHG